MSAPRNFEWPQWRVSCTCLDDDGKPFLVRESCESCAVDRAVEHRNQGHQPSIHPPHLEARRG